MSTIEILKPIATRATTRPQLWVDILNNVKPNIVAEIGVFEGHFAEILLRDCPSITKYLMVDPWRHLDDWDKPSNKSDERHNLRYQETLRCTDFAKEKRVILRGTTIEMIDEIEDDSLDFIYIDGDHTLRGITMDLSLLWPKLKEGGYIGCDDYCSDIWQHSKEYEPTFIFPYVNYFCDAMGAKLYSLPFSQCLFQKTPKGTAYEFTDLVGTYSDATVRKHLLKFTVPMWDIDKMYNKAKEIKRSLLH